MKTRIHPDACKMRKLIRDPNCRPVLRGILESLLKYLTEDLGKRTPRNAEGPDLRRDTYMKTKTSEGKFQKSGGAKDQKCRRLTSFQLLQSKFLKSSPKPFTSHQREVGTLSSGRGAPRHDEDTKRDQTKRPQGPKRRSSVKEIVAKFAVAERKEQQLQTQKKQPKLAGRGILLSSLVETFENVATVRKKSDFKFSHGKIYGGVPSAVRETVARLEGEKQRASDATVKPLKQTKTTGRDPGLDRAENVFTKVNWTDETDPREICSSSNQASADFSKIQTASNEAESPEKTLKNGRQELLPSASVSEWSPPEPRRVLLHEELPLTWNIATIVTCSPVLSTCVDTFPEEHLQEASDSPNLDKRTDGPCEDLESSSRICSPVSESPNLEKRTDGPCKDLESSSRICSPVSKSPNLDKRIDDPFEETKSYSRTCSVLQFSPEEHLWEPSESPNLDKRAYDPCKDLESSSRTCPPVQSRSVDPSLEEHLRKPSESPNQDKRTGKTTVDPLDMLELSSRSCSPVCSRCVDSSFDKRTENPPEDLESSSATGESFIKTPETKLKPSEDAGSEDLNLPGSGPQGFSIPCQISPSSQSEPTRLLESHHHMTDLGPVFKTLEHLQDVGSYNSCCISKPGTTKEKSKENASETVEKGKGLENGDFGTPQSFRLSVEATGNDAFKDRGLSVTRFQLGRDIKQKPKYTTINYGEPSVKQTYKPKIIRFTDTFNF